MSESQPPVVTTHIQELIRSGYDKARVCNGKRDWVDELDRSTIDVLEKAAADLRHAAEELTAERLALLGWPQT